MISISSQQVKNYAIALGFHQVGIAAIHADAEDVEHPMAATNQSRLKNWLQQGYHAEMAWMDNPRRQDVLAIMPEAQSMICVALNYYVAAQRPTEPGYGKVARYAWGRDYHNVMTKRLKRLSQWLKRQDDTIQARWYVDTGPIQDKVWAQQAGLGWVAKNSNLITRDYGSWVFLGEILTNLPLDPDFPHTSHCGTCTRCMDACPTGAIAQPFVVDANRCIAYHTIENRATHLPASIVPDLQGWVAGCDICQDVCPWNIRFAQPTDVTEFHPNPDIVAPALSVLANLTDADYQAKFQGSALRRIKPYMWHRNAQACFESSSTQREANLQFGENQP